MSDPPAPTADDLTVAVATCGRPAGLARCLQALSTGSARPREVIVVDQAPSAEARSAIHSAGSLRTRYLEQPRLGLSASRNLALTSTVTPLLAVTDDDCVPDSGWVAALVAAFARQPNPAAVTGSIVASGSQPPGMHAVSLRPSLVARDHHGRTLPWDVGSGANFAASTTMLRSLGGWDERLGVGSPGRAAEDIDLILRLLTDGALVRYAPEAVVAHEWQTLDQRLRSRSTYGFGVGARCGLRLRTGDAYAVRMLAAYARLHAVKLARAARRRERALAGEHVRALAALVPGTAYGLRAQPRTREPGTAQP